MKMVNIRSQKQLSVVLSRLKTFVYGKVSLEQYSTDPNIAAFVVWHANLIDSLDEKTVLDLGCGTGILGLGCLLLNAGKVIFVDKDEDALDVLKQNIKFLDENFLTIKKNKYKIIKKDIGGLKKKDIGKVDIVIMNPPFGVKYKHADKRFLEKAFSTRKVVYSIHKIESKNFLEQFSKDSKYEISHFWEKDFVLKQTMLFHRRRIKRIKVCVCRFVPL